MKKLRQSLTLALVLCAINSFGQNTILWKLTKTNSNKVSYLLGSYHLMGNSFVDTYPIISQKILDSDMIVTEVKIDRSKTVDYYKARPSSNTLSTVLSKEDVDFIKSIFKKSQIDVAKFTPGELFFRLQAALPKYKCAGLNSDDEWMMDEYIQNLGNQMHKSLYFLETDSMQLETLRQMTKVYSWNYFKAKAPALIAQYKNDTPDEAICALTNQYNSFVIDYKFDEKCSVSPSVKKRNKDWMGKIPDLLEKNNCFITVGLAHLYSNCGLIEQLKELGYNIEPVPLQQKK